MSPLGLQRASDRRLAPPLAVVEGLTAGYDGWTVLKNIRFQVRSGETVGVLGHNGAGKTTLLRTLAGLLKPTSGRIVFAGLDIASWCQDTFE